MKRAVLCGRSATHRHTPRNRRAPRNFGRAGAATLALVAALSMTLSACAPSPGDAASGETGANAGSGETGSAHAGSARAEGKKLRVVATTGILADLARNVAGERAQVTQMVPNGADPHSWEPSLRAIRDVAYADVALSNYLLLEEHSLIRALDSNLPASALSVSVAEEAAKNGATILPLVEDRSLDTPWLGMRVVGDGRALGATRASTIDLKTTSVEGPGQASAYLTTSFGTPEVAFASSDGFDAASGYSSDTATLPADAHQHMSWAFTAPGIYRVHFEAQLRTTPGAAPISVGSGTTTFAVGVPADEIAAQEGRSVLRGGHADVSVDLNGRSIVLTSDVGALESQADTSTDEAAPEPSRTPTTTPASAPASPAPTPAEASALTYETTDLERVVIEVPTRALTTIPGEGGYRFIGEAGGNVYMLPQAVLGKHVHGDIDPHLWHNVHNAQAYVKVIRDALMSADPQGEDTYRSNAATYLARLDEVDQNVHDLISSIPTSSRKLVTTNDAYGYLAQSYGLTIAGFVAPNPSVEPSVADRIKLQSTLADASIPAVFLEPNLARTRSTLRTAARDAGVSVCPLYGDTLDDGAPTYIDMMLFNARSLARCLGGKDDQ